MKTKAALVILFLFAFGASHSEAAVNERRPSFFYGPLPYEYGYSEPEEQLRPAYMPREFGRRGVEQVGIIPAPAAAPSLPGLPETGAGVFLPFEYARERFLGNVPPPAPPRMEETAAPHGEPPPPGFHETEEFPDGFIPYEYARRRFGT